MDGTAIVPNSVALPLVAAPIARIRTTDQAMIVENQRDCFDVL